MSLLYLFFSNHFSAITSQGTHVVKKKEKEGAEADGADVGAVRFRNLGGLKQSLMASGAPKNRQTWTESATCPRQRLPAAR